MCDYTCSNVMCMLNYLLIKPKKIFECFICLWKWFYTFVFLDFVQNAFLCFFFKNWFRGSFARSSRLRVSRKKCLREIYLFIIIFPVSYKESRYCFTCISLLNPYCEMLFRQKIGKFSISYRGYRDCFATKSFSRKLLCFSRLILRLPNPQKTCVFSFI